MDKVKSNLTLGNALAFTPDDLKANRAGFLTHPQRQRQRRRIVKELSIFGAFVCFFGGFFFSFARDYADGSRTNSVILDSVFGGAMTLGFFGYFVYKLIGFGIEIQQNPIKLVVGTVHNTVRRSKSAPPVVQIQKLEFVIPDKAVNVLVEGEEYCIFYTPYTKLILSVEPSTIGE